MNGLLRTLNWMARVVAITWTGYCSMPHFRFPLVLPSFSEGFQLSRRFDALPALHGIKC
jgi:hypothetical protein